VIQYRHAAIARLRDNICLSHFCFPFQHVNYMRVHLLEQVILEDASDPGISLIQTEECNTHVSRHKY